MLQRAKFCADRSNFCRDMADFRFFQDGGRPTSCICFTCIWTTHEEHLLVFVTVQKFGWNRCSGFDNMPVLMFCEFGLKMPIYAPYWLVFGGLDPLHETQYQPILQKFHLLIIAVPAVCYLCWCL